ncbi:hypothetical protein ACJX0J_007579, partial [Zea mays]
DTFVDFPDNIISEIALADLLEKEVEEEEENTDLLWILPRSIIFEFVSGGMLLGVDLDLLNKEDGFKWALVFKEIISKLDEIDKRAESVPLSTSDGTKGRRKNRIFQMHNGDRMLYEDREYYKDLFGPPERLANGDWKTVETKFERNTKRGARENRLFQITFFWQGDGHKKKYRLARWDVICQPKELGGLGILNLEIQNKCLLSKWLNVAIIKDLFMSKGTFQVKDGKNSTVAFVFSTGSMVPTSDVFMWNDVTFNKSSPKSCMQDQDTFGLVIGGL